MQAIPETCCNQYLNPQTLIRQAPTVSWVTAKVTDLPVTVQLPNTMGTPIMEEIQICQYFAQCNSTTNYQWWVKGITPAPLTKQSPITIGQPTCKTCTKKTTCKLGLGPHKPTARFKAKRKPHKQHGLACNSARRKLTVKKRMTTTFREHPFTRGPHKAFSHLGYKLGKYQNPLWEGDN